MKNKKAFTLVELLAVIVILAVILVIAVPQVLDVIDSSKIGSLESSAKLIASTAEKKYAEYLALGKDTSTIQCSDVSKLNNKDYGLCTISFDENGKATVSIKGKENGKFEGLKCSGTKDNISCKEIPILPIVDCTFTAKVYTVKDYDACMTYLKSTVPEEELTDEILNLADSICKGNGIPEYGESTSEIFEGMISGSTEIEQELIDLDVINVELDLTPGTEYVNGQYTYRYMQEYEYDADDWNIIDINGWGVTLTDKVSSKSVTSEVCTYINNIPIVSMNDMFTGSNATSIDLSSFNTSNVTNMSGMFENSEASSLDLSNFDTSNVTDMGSMFNGSAATNLNLSNFDTSNVISMSCMFCYSTITTLDLSNFNTSNVKSMSGMFSASRVKNLNLSNFDTSNVTNMSDMFAQSSTIYIDLSSFDTTNVTNMSEMFMWNPATSLDLSSFDTTNVTNMSMMFYNCDATTGYARTQTDADKFNSSSNKPSTLNFVVKGS